MNIHILEYTTALFGFIVKKETFYKLMYIKLRLKLIFTI